MDIKDKIAEWEERADELEQAAHNATFIEDRTKFRTEAGVLRDCAKELKEVG